MKKFLMSLGLFACLPVIAETPNDIQSSLHNVAKNEPLQKNPSLAPLAENPTISLDELAQNPQLTQQLLNQAIYARLPDLIVQLLPIYRQFENADQTLIRYAEGKQALLQGDYSQAIRLFRQILAKQPELNPVRIELAIALFYDQQNNAAQAQFEKAQSEENLPESVGELISQYRTALQKRNEWQFSGYVHYERDTNVNNTGKQAEIEQTGYIKNADMLPQHAHGLGFGANVRKDFNLLGSHYLSFENDFYGKAYWDNHDYDDLSNRILFGYAYKQEKQSLRLLPFYERRWYGGESYRWSNGGRAEYSRWFSPKWQLSTAFEYGKNRYFDSTSQNGTTKLASATLLWLRNPQQFFYAGSDFVRESVRVRRYSSDTKSLRIGWGQEWQTFGLSSRLGLSFSERKYKDTASLGGLISLGKTRQDKVYGVSLSLWKRDWHWFGITPKLQLRYRKHDSNLPSLHSYTDKSANVVFETVF